MMKDDKLKTCKKIGIMGGTFNPIHIGHLWLARFAQEFAQLDAILFIPSGTPYMKRDIDILDGEDRLQMVKLCIEKESDFYVSDMEIKRKGYTYTYETLQELKQWYPDADLYFMTGADCLFSLEKWKHPELILKYCTVIAATRGLTEMEELERKKEELTECFGGEILLMEFPTIDISSTVIRQRIREGKSIRNLTPDAVCGYIQERGFYL